MVPGNARPPRCDTIQVTRRLTTVLPDLCFIFEPVVDHMECLHHSRILHRRICLSAVSSRRYVSRARPLGVLRTPLCFRARSSLTLVVSPVVRFTRAVSYSHHTLARVYRSHTSPLLSSLLARLARLLLALSSLQALSFSHPPPSYTFRFAAPVSPWVRVAACPFLFVSR